MITRRDLMVAGATVVAAQAVAARAADTQARTGDPAQAFTRAAADCVGAGEACLQHCLTLLASGDKTLGDCALLVNQMLAVCRAVGPIVEANGKYVRSIAQLCLEVCTDCERVCRQHAEHHAICKTCADSCAAVVAAAKPLTV
jgi:Cys-rich four helix bundle protein (predicted Tat secretion target)